MNKQVDKGFYFAFNKLSNRRKFIRSVWFSLIFLVYFIFLFFKGASSNKFYIFFGLMILVSSFNIIFRLRVWKKEKTVINIALVFSDILFISPA